MSTMITPPYADAGAPALHPTPSLPAALRAQVRAMGIHHRGMLLGVVVLSALLALLLGLSLAGAPAPGDPGVETWHFNILPGAIPPLLLLAAVWALMTWRHDRPSERGYLLAAPIDRRLHKAMRVAAGWVWLMAAVTVYLVALGVMMLTAGLPEYFIGDLAARGALPFAGATLSYLAASVATLLSEHPAWWLIGIIVASPFVAGLLFMISPDASMALQHAIGSFGHAQTGMDPPEGTIFPESWGGAFLLWGSVTLAAVAAACIVRRER